MSNYDIAGTEPFSRYLGPRKGTELASDPSSSVPFCLGFCGKGPGRLQLRNAQPIAQPALASPRAGRGFYDITSDVQGLVTQARFRTGLCTLHLQHTSASLVIQENADPDVRADFERFFDCP